MSSRADALRDLKEHHAASVSLRDALRESDRNTREKKTAQSEHILHLPDEFYSSHLNKVKTEILQLQHLLAEARELEEDHAIVEARLAASVKVLDCAHTLMQSFSEWLCCLYHELAVQKSCFSSWARRLAATDDR